MSDQFAYIDPTRLGAGARDGTNFLRDDQVWSDVGAFIEHVNRTGADSSHWPNSTAVTNLFPPGQDEFNAEDDSSYLFTLVCRLANTGTTAASLRCQTGGTATFGNVSYQMIVGYRDVDQAGADSWHGWRTITTQADVTTLIPATAKYMNVRMEGSVDVTVAGTFIPQMSWSVAPGSTTLIKRGALWRVRRIGPAGMTVAGDFS